MEPLDVIWVVVARCDVNKRAVNMIGLGDDEQREVFGIACADLARDHELFPQKFYDERKHKVENICKDIYGTRVVLTYLEDIQDQRDRNGIERCKLYRPYKLHIVAPLEDAAIGVENKCQYYIGKNKQEDQPQPRCA